VRVIRASPALAALNTPGQPNVRVEDGPWLERPTEPDVICVGWEPDEGEAVSLTPTYDLGSTQESYDVVCLASSFSGGTDLAARRVRSDALVEAVRAELMADPTLGGAVTHAEVTTQSWAQFQTSSGCEVPIEFTVHVEAFRIP
jgi:hypothetical protein